MYMGGSTATLEKRNYISESEKANFYMYMKGQRPLIHRSSGSGLHIRIRKSEFLYVYGRVNSRSREEELHIRIRKSEFLYVYERPIATHPSLIRQ
jgi:hypothetical protein